MMKDPISKSMSMGLCLLVGAMMASCGGGGDAASGAPETDGISGPLHLANGAYAVTFTPGKAVMTSAQGWDASIDVRARVTGPFSGYVYTFLVDSGNAISPSVLIVDEGDGQYSATINVNPALPAGRYTGGIELRLCQDAYCERPYPGSPWRLPYDITVTASGGNLTPLSRIPGAPDWTTYQGNASHTGYVPMSLDARNFSRRWQWQAPARNGTQFNGTINQINPVAVSDGTLYVSTRKAMISGDFSNLVMALDEHDGRQRWQTNLGILHDTNPPAVSDARVFVASSGHEDTFMWTLDRSTGAVGGKMRFGSQWEHYYAPTVYQGGVYTNAGAYGGLLKVQEATGAQVWFTSELPQFDDWTPAVDEHYAYSYITGAGLTATNVADGSRAFAIQDRDPADQFGPHSMLGSPVITSDSTVIGINGRPFEGQNRLTRFDIPSRSVSWTVRGYFPNTPAYAKGVIYVAQSSPFRVEARRETDGVLLWTWNEPNARSSQGRPLDLLPAGGLIVTDTHVFVSSAKATYAIDLQTRQSVWSYPRAGELALSAQGVLTIAPQAASYYGDGSEGRLIAINLK